MWVEARMKKVFGNSTPEYLFVLYKKDITIFYRKIDR